MLMQSLTFLLTLKDRASYTTIWLKANINPNYSYIIADGSLGDENELLFADLELSNLIYIRYPKDESVAIYLGKIVDALKRVDTKYVMLCDNDCLLYTSPSPRDH
jgi:hypothetical protein